MVVKTPIPPESFSLRVVGITAEESLFEGHATFVVCPGEAGELGILIDHVPLLTRLLPGMVRVVDQYGDKHSFYCAGGILEVQARAVTILADSIVRAADKDEGAAKVAKHAAKLRMEERAQAVDYAKAELELSKTISEIRSQRFITKPGF